MKNSILWICALFTLHEAALGKEKCKIGQPPIVEIITNPSRGDGFGAQFQTIVFSAIYAELNNKKFIYTPFKNMEHNYDDDADFISKKEDLINFIDHFEINKNPNIQPHNHSTYHTFFENNIALCVNSNSLKKIKEVFRLNKTRETYFDEDHLHIAVHVRRPNPHDGRIQGTDVPNEVYLRNIQFLRETYSAKNPLIHIYSQGDVNTFKEHFGANDTIFHINQSIEDTFTSMVLADVLISSASSFSYIAGILSEGTVYYIPFWHPPLPKWIVLE